MSSVKGYCDPSLKEIKDILSASIESGYEIGASVAISHSKEMVVNLHGGHKDEAMS